MNSVLLTSERASTTLGLTPSHLVKLNRATREKRFYHRTLSPSKPQNLNQRQLIAEKGSFDGGVKPPTRALAKRRLVSRCSTTFRAALTERYPSTVRGCFMNGAVSREYKKVYTVMSSRRNPRLGLGVGRYRVRTPVSPATVHRTPSTGRCFSQFDRKTDCYRNGMGRGCTPKLQIRNNPVDTVHCSSLWNSNPNGDALNVNSYSLTYGECSLSDSSEAETSKVI